MSLFGLSLFGLNQFGLSLFGLNQFGLSLFGLDQFGLWLYQGSFNGQAISRNHTFDHFGAISSHVKSKHEQYLLLADSIFFFHYNKLWINDLCAHSFCLV